MEVKKLSKILYAEDDADIKTIVSHVFELLTDFEVKACENGKQVLDSLDDFCPDLLILDVMMPEMDGLTAYKHIIRDDRWVNLPVIFMTAKAQFHEIETLKRDGAVNIITKPFDPMELPGQIQSIWEACCAK